MFTIPGQSVLRLFMLFFMSIVLVSCGENSATESSGAGITFRLKWPLAKSVGSASSIPVEVVTIRMSVSGPGMTTMSKDFVVSAGSGSIANVPVGSSRTITFQGLDADSILKYQASVPGVNLEAGKTYDCGQVPMAVQGTAVPTVPASLSATATAYDKITLVWSSANDATGYKIERTTGAGGNYVQVGVVTDATVTTWSDASLTASTPYTYRVRAVNGIGYSAYSSEASATTLVRTYGISGSIKSGNSPVAGVTLALSGGGSATTNGNGYYSFTNLQNAASYTLTPTLNGYVFSPASLTVSVNGADSSLNNFEATAVPVVPTGLTAVAASSNLVNLSWTAANGTSSYEIERTTGATVSAPIAVAAGLTTYRDTGLAASTAYSYRVRAVIGAQKSEYCAAVSATTAAAGTAFVPDLVNVGNFSIGRYEVTQGEWRSVMGSNPAIFSSCGDNCPVENVSWNDVQNFITSLNTASGKAYRLPTAAEWQYAAKGGALNETFTYSGSNTASDVAWYSVNSGNTTHQVGQKQSNGLGIYDMSGNVWEWVSDASGQYRVVRGGGWGVVQNVPTDVSTTASTIAPPTYKGNMIGFRLAASP